MTNTTDKYRTLSEFTAHAESLGWVVDPDRPRQRLRDLAADAKIPAKLLRGKWRFDPALTHVIAERAGFVRADRRHAA